MQGGSGLLNLYNEHIGYLDDGAADVFEPTNPMMGKVGDWVLIDSADQVMT